MDSDKINHGVISKEVTQLLKGISCLMIILHHYSQHMLSHNYSSSLFYQIFSNSGGYVGVAIFFFLSGYGLMQSEKNKHLNFPSFLKRRFWKIYKPFLLVNILTIIIFNLSGFRVVNDFSEIIMLVTGIKLVSGVLWFVQVLFLLYTYFFLTSLLKNRLHKAIIISFLIIISMLLGIYFDIGSTFWISIPAFAIGVIYSLFTNEVSIWFQKIKNLVIISIFILACVIVPILLTGFSPNYYLYLHGLINIIIIGVFIVFFANSHFEINYNSFIGKISYECYLIHMAVFNLYLYYFEHIINIGLFLIITILGGFILHFLFNYKLPNFKLIRK